MSSPMTADQINDDDMTAWHRHGDKSILSVNIQVIDAYIHYPSWGKSNVPQHCFIYLKVSINFYLVLLLPKRIDLYWLNGI